MPNSCLAVATQVRRIGVRYTSNQELQYLKSQALHCPFDSAKEPAWEEDTRALLRGEMQSCYSM